MHPAQKRRLALSPTFPVSIVSIAIARAIAVAAIPVSTAMAACSATTPAVTAAMAILASVAATGAAVASSAAIAALIPPGTAVRAAIVISGPARVAAAAVPGARAGRATGFAGASAVARPAGAAISAAPATCSAGGGLAALSVVSCAEVGVIEDVGEIRGNLSKRVLDPVRHAAHACNRPQADEGTQQRNLEEVVSLLAGRSALHPMAQSGERYFHESLVQIGRAWPFILLCLGHYLSQSMPFR